MPNARRNLKLILAINRANTDYGARINGVPGANCGDFSR
jgi:hypothetical protein